MSSLKSLERKREKELNEYLGGLRERVEQREVVAPGFATTSPPTGRGGGVAAVRGGYRRVGGGRGGGGGVGGGGGRGGSSPRRGLCPAADFNRKIWSCKRNNGTAGDAVRLFAQMKGRGVTPNEETYSAVIAVCDRDRREKLALEYLGKMKGAGLANAMGYSAAISAVGKARMWEKALKLFREAESSGVEMNVVMYNATMTALEKGLQWERALDLFAEMRRGGIQPTVVSYGTALCACEKGMQWRQCLDFLDEMTEVGIEKNNIIFGTALSCMEKSGRADIALQILDRMKLEGVSPNVHNYNTAIVACARYNAWERGYGLFREMESAGIERNHISYNSVLENLRSRVRLARTIFVEGMERGYYSKVWTGRGRQLALDVHDLSHGAGEAALWWWVEECLVPLLSDRKKRAQISSIDLITGKSLGNLRGAREGGDGMHKRLLAMLGFMSIREVKQPNTGRIRFHVESMVGEIERGGGKIHFDDAGYNRWREENTTAMAVPEVPQIRKSLWGAPRNGEGKNGGGVCNEPSYGGGGSGCGNGAMGPLMNREHLGVKRKREKDKVEKQKKKKHKRVK